MVVEDLGKGGPDRGTLFQTSNQLSVVILLIVWPGMFRWLRFSQKCTYDRGCAPVFLSVLICSFKVWICMSGWWIACACVCLIPGFSSERMGKHWAFYFHQLFSFICLIPWCTCSYSPSEYGVPDVLLCAAGAMVNGNVSFPRFKAFIRCPTPHTCSMIICQYSAIQ